MVGIGRGAVDRARAMLLETLAIAVATGSKSASQSVFEVSAGLASARGEWERAARLYGAAEALAAQTGFKPDSADEAFLAPQILKARSMLSSEQFDSAVEAGRALGVDEALAEARTWLSEGARESGTSSVM
jgi:hypothetical protein